MTDKSTSIPFDISKFMMPAFSNWSFAEREDKLEERTFAGIQRVHQSMWAQAEKAFDEHMSFVSHRLHEDFECAKALGNCRMPDEAFATLQSFYSKMASEYQDHAQKQFAMIQNSLNENLATAEELGETALATATELTKAAEETIEDAAASAAQAKKPAKKG